MDQKKIIVVEDEQDILEVLAYNLKREGFMVDTSLDGEEGLNLVQAELPDLVLLDLMLPGMSGLDVCRHMRGIKETESIPIVMLTAKGEESDIVLGLGLGADDYVVKPFSPKELIARVHAVLRRTKTDTPLGECENINVHGLEIDSRRHKALLHGRDLGLTTTEFQLLHYLASHPGWVFSREQLLDQTRGRDTMVIDRNIDVHIRAIRKKTGDDQHFIETIRGVGYRFRDLDENRA